jgi:hypothetical protein
MQTMKIRLACLCSLAIAFIAAQAQTAPPVKMGLWKTTSVMTTSGFQLPPDVAARMKAMGRSPGQPANDQYPLLPDRRKVAEDLRPFPAQSNLPVHQSAAVFLGHVRRYGLQLRER